MKSHQKRKQHTFKKIKKTFNSCSDWIDDIIDNNSDVIIDGENGFDPENWSIESVDKDEIDDLKNDKYIVFLAVRKEKK